MVTGKDPAFCSGGNVRHIQRYQQQPDPICDETAAAYQAIAHLSLEHHEAVRAFIENRASVFS